MNRKLAWKAWLLPVIWAADDPKPQLAAIVEPAAQAPAVVNHYHLHLAPGTDLTGLSLALPQGSVVTTAEDN